LTLWRAGERVKRYHAIPPLPYFDSIHRSGMVARQQAPADPGCHQPGRR
jgi:hypothetical protein